MPVGKELRRIDGKIVSLRAKMVIDDIQQNHDSAGVGALHQAFQIFRAAIGAIRCKSKHTVITPIALTGKISNRH